MNDKNIIFTPDDYAQTNAMLGSHWNYESLRMIDGYGKGALFLIKAAVEEYERDTLIYPVLFLFRHYVELIIKETFIYLKQLNDECVDRTQIKGHSLNSLAFKEIIKAIDDICKDREWEEGFPEDIKQIIEDLDKIDSSGQYFKYTHDNKGNQFRDRNYVLVGYQELYIKIERVYKYFDGMIAWIDHELELKAEMEAEMRSYMDY